MTESEILQNAEFDQPRLAELQPPSEAETVIAIDEITILLRMCETIATRFRTAPSEGAVHNIDGVIAGLSQLRERIINVRGCDYVRVFSSSTYSDRSIMDESELAEALDEIDAEPEAVHIPPLGFLKTCWQLLWSTIRHPFQTSFIDMSTGRVIGRK